MIFCHLFFRSALVSRSKMSHSSTPAAELRNRKVASSKSTAGATVSGENDSDSDNNAKPPVVDPDDWTWAEFRYLALRALAVIVLFSVLHTMVQKVLLDPFAGIEPPFTEADAQRAARQFKNR